MSFVRFALGRMGFPLLSLAFVAVYWFMTRDLPKKVTSFPYMFVVGSVVLCTWIIGTETAAWLKARRTASARERKEPESVAERWAVFIATALYIALMPFVGFLATSTVFMLFLYWYLGEKRPIYLFGITAGTIFVYWLIFIYLLHVPAPRGFLI